MRSQDPPAQEVGAWLAIRASKNPPAKQPTETWDGIERRSGVKRRKRRVYRFIDRRSGFDRRKRYPLLGTIRDHPRLLVLILVFLNLLSLLDGAFTAFELWLGVAAEGNPVLDAAVQRSPLLAVAVKIGSMLLVTASIWHGRRNRTVLALSIVALALFAAVVAYHWGSLMGMGIL